MYCISLGRFFIKIQVINYGFMRTIGTLIVFWMVLLLLAGCQVGEDYADSIKLVKIIPGGCAINHGNFYKSESALSDTVTYSFAGGNLDIFVGFHATCCGEYSTFSSVRNDSVFIHIKTVKPGMCNCMCYYTYDFLFSGFDQSHAIIVKFDDILFYSDIVNP